MSCPYFAGCGMKLNQCYQLFHLVPGASLTDIKAAYRRLARLLHPDLHPTDRHAQKRFIVLNQAYKILQDRVSTDSLMTDIKAALDKTTHTSTTISSPENDLKWSAYQKLQDLLQRHQLNQAVAVVDGLAQRYSQDLHIRQWQGIVYYFSGQYLIDLGQIDKAKIYLKKAKKADPQNVQLSEQINWEYQRITRIMT
jgi:tetratricopeptide (TPR) repeat protein